MRRKLAAGNWKMNGLSGALAEIDALQALHRSGTSDVLVCPPATLLSRLSGRLAGSGIATGGQDCHAAASGAHTGDISAEMLVDAGASHVILGHSERRTDHFESSEQVSKKARAAHRAGLIAVICVGETEAQRDAGTTLDIIGEQLAASVPGDIAAKSLVLAYEPVWAIGTGRVPTLAQIGEVHDFIRGTLENSLGRKAGGSVRILYGGSVKPGNAPDIFAVANVDGALVGGASLKANDFSQIIQALDLAG